MDDFDWMQKRKAPEPESKNKAADYGPVRDLTDDWPESEGYATFCFVSREVAQVDYRDEPYVPPEPPEPEQRNILEIIRRCERMLDSGDTDLQTDAPSIIIDIVTEFREEIEPMFDGLMECESTGDLIDSATDVVCWWQEKIDGLEDDDG
jgi:hypothetical protein